MQVTPIQSRLHNKDGYPPQTNQQKLDYCWITSIRFNEYKRHLSVSLGKDNFSRFYRSHLIMGTSYGLDSRGGSQGKIDLPLFFFPVFFFVFPPIFIGVLVAHNSKLPTRSREDIFRYKIFKSCREICSSLITLFLEIGKGFESCDTE